MSDDVMFLEYGPDPTLGMRCNIMAGALRFIGPAVKKIGEKRLAGIVAGFKQSGACATDSRNMDLVVETDIDGRTEYVRVATPYGASSKLHYRCGDRVSFYQLGKTFIAER